MDEGLAALDLLVIDDNAQMRTIIGTVLGAAGIRKLHYAPNGRLGLEVLSQRPIDVAYVDFEMPVMNGLEFISAVRAMSTSDRYLPVIMLTGHSDLKRIVSARDRGVTEFLGKPVTAKSILARLNMVILHPRQFITAPRYFGPDRRRKSSPSYAGPMRRTSDAQSIVEL